QIRVVADRGDRGNASRPRHSDTRLEFGWVLLMDSESTSLAIQEILRASVGVAQLEAALEIITHHEVIFRATRLVTGGPFAVNVHLDPAFKMMESVVRTSRVIAVREHVHLPESPSTADVR